MTTGGLQIGGSAKGKLLLASTVLKCAGKGSNDSFSEVFDKMNNCQDNETCKAGKQTTEKIRSRMTDSKHQKIGSSEKLKRKQTEKSEKTGIPEDVQTQISSEVKQVICEELQMSETDLESAMQALGLKDTDLLAPENLQKLVLEVNGLEDPANFIIDEKLQENMNSILEAVENIISETADNTELSDAESMSETLDGLWQKTDADKNLSESENTEEDGKAEAEDFKVEVVKLVENAQNEEFNSDTGEFERRNLKSEVKGNGSVSENDMSTGNIFLNNLVEKFTGEVDGIEGAEALREIATQIVDKIKVTLSAETNTLEMTLNPENLGKVSLTVTEKNGILTASFKTESQVAKDAIASQLELFKESLAEQGLKVEAIEVTVSEFNFAQGNAQGEQSQSGGSGQKSKKAFRYDDGEDDKTVDDSIDLRGILSDSGQSVDYMA